MIVPKTLAMKGGSGSSNAAISRPTSKSLGGILQVVRDPAVPAATETSSRSILAPFLTVTGMFSGDPIPWPTGRRDDPNRPDRNHACAAALLERGDRNGLIFELMRR